ncbi:ABC transporter permease [Ilyobacter polytropus]|nr:ABC transporter permease [Ilyobacter polytropus]
MIEFFIAKKHIIERKKQSIISILGMTIGIAVLIVSIGIANGLDKNMIESILSITSHVVVQDNGDMENYRDIQKKIESIEGVKGVVPKTSTQGILKYNGVLGSYVSGVKIEGLDLADAKRAMELDKKIVQGTMDFDNPTQLLMGKELYEQLGANLGDEVSIVSADNREVRFKIGGVFQSGYYEYDTSLVMLPLRAVQVLTYSGNTVSKMDVMLYDAYKSDEVASEINSTTGLNTKTWGQLNRNLLSALSLEKTVMIIVFSLIVVIAGFVVWVTLNMLVREKTRDIGVMRAMGFSSEKIMKIFLIEGMVLGVMGIIIGTAVALGILWYVKNYSIAQLTSIYYLTKIPVELSLKEIFTIIGANLVVIFISSIFPAYRAAKLQPVEALRYE